MSRYSKDSQFSFAPGASYPSGLPRSRIQTAQPAGRIYQAPFASRPYSLGGDERAEVRGSPLPKGVFMGAGTFLILMTIASPIYECIRFLHNFNYVYWNGIILPYVCIVLCLVVLITFLVITQFLFHGERLESASRHDIGMMAATMATLIGLVFLLISMIGAGNSFPIELALGAACETSVVTHAARTWYAQAEALRATPECSKLYTIEDCPGFAALAAQEDEYLYIKSMEETYRCQGFCGSFLSNSTGAATTGTTGNSSATGNKTGLVQFTEELAPRRRSALVTAFLGRESDATPMTLTRNDARIPASLTAITFPPTLFSDANFDKVSCQGAAATNLRFASTFITHELWWQGIVLVACSVLIGFTDWASLLKR